MIDQAAGSAFDTTRYRDLGLVIAGAVGLLLSAALVLEFAFDMEPCPLCLTQRLFFMLAGFIALLSAGVSVARRGWPIATGLTALIGAYFSLRQLYLYFLPPDQIPACSAPISRLIEFAPFMEVFTAMTMGTGNCAEASFPILGWDMPGYLIPLGALAGFSLVTLLTYRQYRIAQ